MLGTKADYTEAIRVNPTGLHHNHLLGGTLSNYNGTANRYDTHLVEPYYLRSQSGTDNFYRCATGTKDKELGITNRQTQPQNHEECYWYEGYDAVAPPAPETRDSIVYHPKVQIENSTGFIKMECSTETTQENSKSDLNIDENSSSLDSKQFSDRNGKHGKQDLKLCGVCGDKALGNNFNAITCESCKAFFRRNALRTKEFVCPFNDSCKVDPVTRRFCQKCRLKKCFDIGMKKEWIMTDEEKKMKKQKIEQNRLKRSSSDSQPLISGEVTAPKVPAVGEEVPEKLNDSLPVDSSRGTEAHAQQQSVKQPMMPHNNNTIPQPPEPSQNHIFSVANKHESTIQLDHSRLPSSVVSSTPANDAVHVKVETYYPGQLDHYAESSPESQCMIWCENSENASTPVTKPTNQLLNQEGNEIASTPFQTCVYPMPKEIEAATDNNADVMMIQNGQPAQMPLLASLIRPGVSESPPDSQLQDSSTSSFPESPENDFVSESISVPEKCVDLYQPVNSTESLHSPAQLPDLTGGSACSQSYDDDDVVSPQSINHSSSRDSSFSEELAPLPLNTMDSILSVAISAEFNAFGVLGHNRNPHSKELNKAEKAKLNELYFASQALNAPVDADGPIKIETSDPSLINVINLTDIAIRRLIKMSKKMCAFKNMCQEDQIALLKGGCTEMMILRSVVSYDPERDSWNIPHSNGYNIKLGVLKEARGNLYEEHQRFVKSFKAEWRSDDNIMIILCAITLFTPERPNVIHKDVVKLEQDSYYYLLKRYLESTRNGCEARSTYLQLIQKVAELHVLNSNHLRVFLEVNPREVEPLLIEIFDLKQ